MLSCPFMVHLEKKGTEDALMTHMGILLPFRIIFYTQSLLGLNRIVLFLVFLLFLSLVIWGCISTLRRSTPKPPHFSPFSSIINMFSFNWSKKKRYTKRTWFGIKTYSHSKLELDIWRACIYTDPVNKSKGKHSQFYLTWWPHGFHAILFRGHNYWITFSFTSEYSSSLTIFLLFLFLFLLLSQGWLIWRDWKNLAFHYLFCSLDSIFCLFLATIC